MPRRCLIRTANYPYHITIRTNNREWFDLPMNEVWNICIKAIKFANMKHNCEVQAFVLMSNHYHLMIWTPFENIDLFMFDMNSYISKKIRRRTGRINRIFGDRYKWCLINSMEYYRSVLKYIYQNPLIAELSNKCENYHYSTLHYHINSINLGIKLRNPYLHEVNDFLNWINDLNKKEYYTISAAVKRPIFSVPKNNSSRRAI